MWVLFSVMKKNYSSFECTFHWNNFPCDNSVHEKLKMKLSVTSFDWQKIFVYFRQMKRINRCFLVANSNKRQIWGRILEKKISLWQFYSETILQAQAHIDLPMTKSINKSKTFLFEKIFSFQLNEIDQNKLLKKNKSNRSFQFVAAKLRRKSNWKRTEKNKRKFQHKTSTRKFTENIPKKQMYNSIEQIQIELKIKEKTTGKFVKITKSF